MKSRRRITLTVAGGLAAQLNALAYSVWIRENLKRKVTWHFYPSVLEHYPLVLDSILKDLDIFLVLKNSSAASFALKEKNWIYRRFERLLRSIVSKLLLILKFRISQNAILSSDLKQIKWRTHKIIGYFPDVSVFEKTFQELNCLMQKYSALSIFQDAGIYSRISVHWRLGDLLRQKSASETHGIVTPETIMSVIRTVASNNPNLKDVFVATDSPEIAEKLLEPIRDEFRLVFSPGVDIFEDIRNLVQSQTFIGTQSYVSVWVALGLLMTSESQKTRVLLPDTWFLSPPQGFEKYPCPRFSDSRVEYYRSSPISGTRFHLKYLQ